MAKDLRTRPLRAQRHGGGYTSGTCVPRLIQNQLQDVSKSRYETDPEGPDSPVKAFGL